MLLVFRVCKVCALVFCLVLSFSFLLVRGFLDETIGNIMIYYILCNFSLSLLSLH